MKNVCTPILLLCAACSAPAIADVSVKPTQTARGTECCAPGCCDDDPNCCATATARETSAPIANAACCTVPVACCEPAPSAQR
jgi:hypothetical protein